MKMEKCFAYKFDEQKQVWECTALQQDCDGCKLGCKFYKPASQREKELAEEKQRKKQPLPVRDFSLLIDGRKHGEFESIQEMDIYLTKFYHLNEKEIDNAYNYLKARYPNLSEQDIDKVMYTHTVDFLHKEA